MANFNTTTKVIINDMSAGDSSVSGSLAKEITDLMTRVANKPASYTYVVFDEVETEDWAIGGNLLG